MLNDEQVVPGAALATGVHRDADDIRAVALREAEEIRASAQRDADDIRAGARRDAEDMVAAARARVKRECAAAEGRAAEVLDAAEHEALEIRRNAWTLAGREMDGPAVMAASGDVLPGVESDVRRRRERELLALAVGTARHASRALDNLAKLVASESADFATSAAILQGLIDSARLGDVQAHGDLALISWSTDPASHPVSLAASGHR